MSQLEHANITVPDIDAAVRFIQLMAPDHIVRQDAMSDMGYRWVHIGNDHSYIALQAVHPGKEASEPHETYKNYGVNHLCFKVDDARGTEKRLLDAGYRQNGPLIEDSHRLRLYFYDDMGLEWEMVEYLSNNPQEMHKYE